MYSKAGRFFQARDGAEAFCVNAFLQEKFRKFML